jgi:hypothetical protein
MSHEITCLSCYRVLLIDLEVDGINEIVPIIQQNHQTIIEKKNNYYYYCKYCKTRLLYINPSDLTKGVIATNRQLRLTEQKNWYKWRRQGYNHPVVHMDRVPQIRTLFDMWGDYDLMLVTIRPVIIEKGVRTIYMNKILSRIWIKKCHLLKHMRTKYQLNEVDCYIECRTEEHEQMLITKNDWEQLEKIYDINLTEMGTELDNIQRFCDLNRIILNVETKNLYDQPGEYVTTIFVGTLHNYKTESFSAKKHTRNYSIMSAYQQTKEYLIREFKYQSSIKYLIQEPSHHTRIDYQVVNEMSIKEEKAIPPKPAVITKLPVQTPTQQNIEPSRVPTMKKVTSSNKTKIQMHNLSTDQWQDFPIDQIESITLSELCHKFAEARQNKPFNARLIINDDMALSFYRSSGIDGRLDQFPRPEPNTPPSSSSLSSSSSSSASPSASASSSASPSPVFQPQWEGLNGYHTWLKTQTKSVQKGIMMLCEICRDRTGTYFDFKERGCGINYCQPCWEKKGKSSIPVQITPTKSQITEKTEFKTINEPYVNESYVVINLKTPEEMLVLNGHHMSLVGWYGGETGRDAKPIFAQYHMTFQDREKYSLDYRIKEIESAWTIDYGLLETIIKYHKFDQSLVPRENYWRKTTLKQVIIGFQIPLDLSIPRMIERIERYYLEKVTNVQLRALSDQKLVDYIYDSKLMRFKINQKHYGPDRPVQSSPFYRKQALLELDRRMNPAITYPVCRVMIKSKDNTWTDLQNLAKIILKENEKAYQLKLPQILKTEYVYPLKEEMYESG